MRSARSGPVSPTASRYRQAGLGSFVHLCGVGEQIRIYLLALRKRAGREAFVETAASVVLNLPWRTSWQHGSRRS